jgi:hypothetical protein
MGSFVLPFVAHPAWLDFIEKKGNGVPPWVYVVVFAFYFCNYFVITFCNAALISCALIRFNGGEPSVGDGLSAAASRLPQILAWSLVSATVGCLLKVVESANEKAGQFISAILGTAWAIMTYFVVPVLVVEKVGPFEAIQRSVAILKKTWGEALVGRMGMGFFLFLLALPGVVLMAMGVFVLAGPMQVVGFGLIALAVIDFLLYGAVSSALQGIFVGALYQYASHGSVPDGFQPESLERAFRQKR